MDKKEKLINIFFIILEIVGISLTAITIKKLGIEYYTQDSNMFALIIGIIYLYYLVNNKKITHSIAVLRLMSVLGLSVTFLVVLFILLPMTSFNFMFMFGGASFFLHLACPVLLFIIYMKYDKKVELSNKEVLLSLLFTIIYSIILISLNILKVVEGPYPFLMVYKQGVIMSIVWYLLIVGGAFLLAKLLYKIKR